MKSFYLSLLLLVLGQRLYGQVVTRRATDQEVSPRGKFNASKDAPAPLTLPAPEVARLLEEDAREAGQNVPPRFGQAVSVSVSPTTDGKWENVEGGRVWKFSITSPKAFSLNFFFDKFYLPRGAQLYLYSGDRSVIMGPITEEQNTAAAGYATDLIKGDLTIFELFEPTEVIGKSNLHLARAVHGYKDLFASQQQTAGSGYNQSLGCEVDVTCPAGNDWQTESNSVAMVLLSNGTRLCSGSMLNNACQNLVPNFLTAFHCVDLSGDGAISAAEQADVQNWVFRFQYKSTYCGGREGYNFTSISGAQFLSAFNPTDFALLRLSQRPNSASNIAYAGWTRSPNPATSSAGIHHPSGDVMKIALSNSANLPSTWSNNGNTHWLVNFSSGTVEHGSSGSPLFDQNHRVVGQLHGYQNSNEDFCNNHTYYYGRFDMSWTGGGTPATRLSDWLTDDPSVVQVDTRQQPTLAISGPAHWTICTGGTRTVSVANLPPNSTVTWSAGAGLIPSSGSGSSATITGDSGYGNTSITFTITPNSGCGAAASPPSQVVTQTLYLNAPTVDLYPSAYTNICAGTPTGVTFGPRSTAPFGDGYFGDPGRSIRWEPAQYITYGQGTGYATFVRPSNSTPFIISVYLTNTCGTTRQDFYYGTNYNCGSYARPVSSESITAYPNPASESIIIPEGAGSTTLINDKGKILQKADASGKIDIQSLPDGLYNLQMQQDGKLINQRIQVKH